MTVVALALVLLSGCTEYILAEPGHAERPYDDTGQGGPPGDDDDDGGAPDDSDDPGPPVDSGDPGGDDDPDDPVDDDDPVDPDDTGDPGDPFDPPDDDPPALIPEECPRGAEASFSPDEIYVLSWDPTQATGTLTSPSSDWFHIYNTSIFESGSSQWNESAYFRVTNSTVSHGLPAFSNCRSDWIVGDGDNSGFPSATLIYVGTFWLDRGDNTLTMNHYCPRYRAGECTSFHNSADSGTTCDSGDANSVHFSGHGICVIRAD